MNKIKMPIYQSAKDFYIFNITVIYWLVSTPFINLWFENTGKSSLFIASLNLIPLISVLYILKTKKYDFDVGHYCRHCNKNKGYEIHIGNDALDVIIARQNGKEEIFERIINEYGEEKRIIYLQLLSHRLHNALSKGKKAYVVAHSWNELFLLRSFENMHEQKASFLVALAHALTQKSTIEHPWYDFKYKLITILKYRGVSHFEIDSTEENRLLCLSLMESKNVEYMIEIAQSLL